MNFQISDKVVCVDDSPGVNSDKYLTPTSALKRGRVYTVEGMRYWDRPNLYGGMGWTALFICGVPHIHKSGIDAGWMVERFRRLEELQNLARVSKRTGIPIEQKP